MRKFIVLALSAVICFCSCFKESDSIVILNEGMEIIGLTVSSKGAEVPIQIYSSGSWSCRIDGDLDVTITPSYGPACKDKAIDATVSVPANTGEEGRYANISFDCGKSNVPLLIFQTSKNEEDEDDDTTE